MSTAEVGLIHGHKPRVLAVRQTALRAAGCLRDDVGPADYLFHVASTFLIAAKGGGLGHGDVAKLNAAAQAVIAWLSTLHQVKGEEKPAPGPSLAEVKGEEKPAPGPSVAG